MRRHLENSIAKLDEAGVIAQMARIGEAFACGDLAAFE